MTTILTQSGRSINLLQPDPALICIEDIAHGLSHLCRFTGHTRSFYSVAQHSLHVSYAVPAKYAFEALLHDATEAYLGDVSSPLKALLPEYRLLEHSMDRAIRKRFGLPAMQSLHVKHADLRMLATERRDLMPHHADAWPILAGIEAQPLSLVPKDPGHARELFLSEFENLTRKAQRGAF